MRFWKLFFLLTFLSACGSGKKLHTEIYRGKPILVGIAKVSDLQKPPYGNWFNTNYKQYFPEHTATDYLKNHLAGKTIEVYMGTWCPDSRANVPEIIKVLDLAGFDRKNLVIHTLPRRFQNDPQTKGKNIARVPTVIVYENGKELGRIVEYPNVNYETDLMNILKENYKQEEDE